MFEAVALTNTLNHLGDVWYNAVTLPIYFVEGRLTRRFGETEYDNRQPVTSIEAERILVLHDPGDERSPSTLEVSSATTVSGR